MELANRILRGLEILENVRYPCTKMWRDKMFVTDNFCKDNCFSCGIARWMEEDENYNKYRLWVIESHIKYYCI